MNIFPNHHINMQIIFKATRPDKIARRVDVGKKEKGPRTLPWVRGHSKVVILFCRQAWRLGSFPRPPAVSAAAGPRTQTVRFPSLCSVTLLLWGNTPRPKSSKRAN